MIVTYAYPIGQFFVLKQHSVPAVEVTSHIRPTSWGAAVSLDRGPFRLDRPWQSMGWWGTAALVGVCFVLGFVVLSRYQQSGPPLDVWNAICRAIGIAADTGPAGEPQPPLRTPTRVAWTRATLDQIASGNKQNGAFIALNCGACHGEQGVSSSSLIPPSWSEWMRR
jgi:cytochrome c553